MPDLSPTPRRIRTPSWLDFRLVLGVVLVVGAGLLGVVLFNGAKRTEPHLALTRPLAAGTTLTADDIATVQVKLPNSTEPGYLVRKADAVGKALNRALGQGELLPRSALGVVDPTATVSLPLQPGSAPGLSSGERVKAWLSTKTCKAVVLLEDVTVQDVSEGSGSFSDSGQNVVLSLDPPLADRVIGALALPDASIRVGTLTGPGQDHANDGLPTLEACLEPVP